jgi:copper chaperone CopZ
MVTTTRRGREEPPVNAVHIHTEGMYCRACPARIEHAVEELPGVKAARVCRDASMTSVLFDPDLIDEKTIRDRITDTGFVARVLIGGRIR